MSRLIGSLARSKVKLLVLSCMYSNGNISPLIYVKMMSNFVEAIECKYLELFFNLGICFRENNFQCDCFM